jgi:hypothetical protein
MSKSRSTPSFASETHFESVSVRGHFLPIRSTSATSAASSARRQDERDQLGQRRLELQRAQRHGVAGEGHVANARTRCARHRRCLTCSDGAIAKTG